MRPIPGAHSPESAGPPDAKLEHSQPAEKSIKRGLGNTKIGKSITENTTPVGPGEASPPPKRPGRPPRTTTAPVTWSVRGVSRETRLVLEQGAERAGKTLGQYLNEDVRKLVERHVQRQEPASSNLQAEIQYLRQLVENLTTMLSTGTLPGRTPEAPTSE